MTRLPAEELWRRAKRGEAHVLAALEKVPEGAPARLCYDFAARGYRFAADMAEAQGEPERQVEVVRRYLGDRAAKAFRRRVLGSGDMGA